MRTRTRITAAVAAIGALFALPGCVSVSTSGASISEPDKPLAAALDRLKKDNAAGIKQGSVRVGEATSCFYQLPYAGADDVTDEVACGPIRRLGKTDQQVWDIYRMTYTQAADGRVTAAVDRATETAVAVDRALLVPGGDAEPATVDQVPAPVAPPAQDSDRAMMLRAGSAEANGLGTFSKLEQPITLHTPAAELTITEAARPKLLPEELFADADDAENVSPAYRPAAGQQAYAFKVDFRPGASTDDLLADSDADPLKDLATALSIDAGGDRPITIADDSNIPNARAADTLTVPCQTAEAAPVPCAGDRTGEGVLLMTVPADAEPKLVATVGDTTQSVELTSGTVTSSVSQVEYERSQLGVELGETITAGPITADEAEKGKGKGDKNKPKNKNTPESSWKLTVDAAQLSAFDPYRGWAPEGKAWLKVATSDYDQTGRGAEDWKADRVASIALDADGSTLRPDGLGESHFDADPDADTTWVFEVPADLTKATLLFKPTGAYTGDKKSRDFTVRSAARYDMSLPE